MKRAAELLAEGDYKMYEVADLAGFASQSNFTRSFQKQYNMTPTEYMHQQHEKKKA
jgi:AraC-like DNA-binding protein